MGRPECTISDSVSVKTKVTNKGSYKVNESVQVYIKHKAPEDYEPGYRLKKVQCVSLAPGEEKEVEITLNQRDFAIITEDGQCVLRPGEYMISIGGHQPDERSEKLTGKKTDIFTIKRTGSECVTDY